MKHTRSQELAMAAQGATDFLEGRLLEESSVETAIVVSPGWDVFDVERDVPLSHVPSFSSLERDDHRRVALVNIDGRRAIALINPLYLHEYPGYKGRRMSRLQIEMLCRVCSKNPYDENFVPGIKRIIFLDAGAGIGIEKFPAVVAVDGFLTVRSGPELPLTGTELHHPTLLLDQALMERALRAKGQSRRIHLQTGGFAHRPGPILTGGKYDVDDLAPSGVSSVGMGLLAWICVLYQYPTILPLALCLLESNLESMLSHHEIIALAKVDRRLFKNYIHRLFQNFPASPVPS